MKKRTEVMERRLKLLADRKLFRKVDPEKYSTLFDFYDIETVVDTLIKNSSGVYFFQSDPDPDGLQRKYPLVGLYEDKLFPSASLAIALNHYNKHSNVRQLFFRPFELNPPSPQSEFII